MKHNKNALDEMQREKRDAIGNQSFILMFYLLMFDSALYGFGLEWLAYPSRVLVIITACMFIYLARVIACNAYLPPRAQESKTRVILFLAISVGFAIAAVLLSVNLPFLRMDNSLNDNSAVILFIMSAVALVIALVMAIIKKISNDKDNKDE